MVFNLEKERTMQLFSFLYRNLKGYRLLVVIAILVTIAQVGCDILTALPLKYIPSKISNPGNDPACSAPFLNPILDRFDIPQIDPSLVDPATHQPVPPPTTQCPVSPTDIKAAANPVLTHHSVLGVIVFSVLMLIVFGILSALLSYLDLFLAAYIAQNLTARLRNLLFDHLQRLSLDWHGKQKKGDLVQRITGNIADIEKLVTDGLVDLLSGILTLAGVAAIMLIISPSYTLISLAIAPALFMIVLSYTKNIKAEARKAARAAGQVADVATEDINALTVIKVFTREEREAMRFGSYVDKNRRAGLKATGLQAQFAPLASFLVIIGTAIVLGVGGYVAASKTVTVGPLNIAAESVDIGTLVLFISFLKLLYQPMRDLSKLANLASSAASGAERIQEVLDQAPEVTDMQMPYHGPQKLRGDITFDNVVFGYTAERPVLKGINLHIPVGRKVGLVGLSGGGKTTLVKLIPRFYEVQQGSVRIDGVDNRMYPLSVLRQNISMVLQDSVLFEGTIRENIAIGKPSATEAEIIDAAKKANIHDMILSTLGGYDRMVREQGKDLSGGQRQRIAIARAILRDAPILILDEPTASLDVEAEAEVMHALDRLIVGRTVITISHRLSALGNVDEIIVLKDGRIVEQGTFKELKQRGGVFASLLEEQNRYSAEKVSQQSIIRSAFISVPLGHEPQILAQPQQANAAGARGNDLHAAWEPARARLKEDLQSALDGRHAAWEPARARGSILVEQDGKIIGERKLDKPVLTIGRLSSNDIAIPNQRVSRLHAKLHWQDGAWVIEDTESVNGIVHQGQRVERVVLSNGDRIFIAPSVALYYKGA
jgi:ATP-binding cassette subfamily B protein